MTVLSHTLFSVMYWQGIIAGGAVWSPLVVNVIAATIVMFIVIAIAVPLSYFLMHRSRTIAYGIVLVLFALRVVPELSTIILNIMPNMIIGVVIDRVIRTLPFVLLIIIFSFQAVPRSLDDSARVDGASGGQVLRYVMIPLAWPGIALAAAFAWFESLGEFIYALYLATLKPIFSPVRTTIEQYAMWYRSAMYVITLVLLMLLIILIVQEKIRKDCE